MTDAASKQGGYKCLFVASDCWDGSGAFRSLTALCRELAENYGAEVFVALPFGGSGEPLLHKADVPYEIFPAQDWIVDEGFQNTRQDRRAYYPIHTQNMRTAADLALFALTNGFDLIHSNTTYCYVGYLAAKLAGIPHVWHLREFLEEDQMRRLRDRDYGYALIADSDRVVTISDALYAKYARIVPSQTLRRIYNGIDPAAYGDAGKRIFAEEAPTFLFLSGSNSPGKGRSDLIGACALLKENDIPFQLCFAGYHGEPLYEEVRAAGLEDRTIYRDLAEDVTPYYAMADVVCVCSRFEAFGRVTVEAMMAGCLVVGANTGGTAEILQDGISGYLYPSGDCAALACKLLDAFADPERSRAIAQAGRRRALAEFSAQRNACNIAQLHRELIAERAAEHPKRNLRNRLDALRRIAAWKVQVRAREARTNAAHKGEGLANEARERVYAAAPSPVRSAYTMLRDGIRSLR